LRTKLKRHAVLVALTAGAVVLAGVTVDNVAEAAPIAASAVAPAANHQPTADPAANHQPVPPSAVADSSAMTDPRQVWLGAVFGQGPVGTVMGAPASLSTPDLVTEANTLTSEVEKKYPGTIDSISAAIATGSPVAVTDALNTAGQRLESLPDPSKQAQALISPNCGVFAIVLLIALWVFVPAVANDSNSQLKVEQEAQQLIELA
jgi:hypothetical protein